MNKIFRGLTVGLFSVVFSFALIAPAHAATNWDVTGTYVWDVFGTYFHDLIINVQNPDGTFSGSAGYPAGSPPYSGAGQTTEQITGLVVGDNFSFTTTYDGPYAPGSVFNMTGTIDANGHISGASPWAWQFTGGVATKDSDHDGVLNGADLCPNTAPDSSWAVKWGNNRWQVQNKGGVLTWYQNKVNKGGTTATASSNTIAYTYGCNGHQIIDLLQGVMNGHLKYGLSSGLLEEFHKDLSDGVLDGLYYVDTVVVNADDTDGVNSNEALVVDKNYVFKASGTANAGDGITFDADFSFRSASSVVWTDLVSTYEGYGATLLDLMVNGGFVNWGDGTTYHVDHKYNYGMVGAGSTVNFTVYDAYYPNNTGSLTVDIYAQL